LLKRKSNSFITIQRNPPLTNGGFFFEYTFLNVYFHTMRNLLLVLFFTFSLSLVAQQNISLLAKLPYGYKLSNVWGYTDETNVEYALVGVEDGLSVVSLANPSNPVEIAKIPGTINKWREIKTFGDYAYVSSESGDGLLIMDLSPLPFSTTFNYVYKTFANSTGICERAHSLAIDAKGFCYLFGTDRNQETIILDIHTNPMNPVEVGSTGLYYTHDGIVAGDTMFLAHIMTGFIGVYNISDRANPQFITSFETPLKFPHNIALSQDGKYLFATDEKTGSFVAAYDVSDFNNIVELDRFQRQERHFPMVHNTHMLNGYLVNSYYLEGLNIVDAHDPKNLVEVGFYDTTPNDSGYIYKGVWGVYPYFASGIILASDIEQGLYVFSANYQRASYVSGTVKNAVSNTPIYDVLVSVDGEDVKDYTDILGVYHSGLGRWGNTTFHFSKKGYYDTTGTVSLLSSTNQILDVFMRPKPTFPIVIKVVDKNNQPMSLAKILIESEDGSWLLNTNNSGVVSADITGVNFKINAGKWQYLTMCDERTKGDFLDTTIYVLLAGVYDDFTFDYLWTATGHVDKGLWVRDMPFGTNYDEILVNPPSDVSGDCSGYALVTGNSKNPDPSFNKVEYIKSELRSPVLDIGSYSHPFVSFYLWFQDVDKWGFGNDSAFISLRNNSELIYLDTIVGSVYSHKAEWYFKYYDLSAYHLSNNNYQLQISAIDTWAANALELGLDVFRLTESSPLKVDTLNFTSIVVFPNPANQKFYLESKEPLRQYNLSNMEGKIILNQKIDGQKLTEICVEYLSAGIYFLEVVDSENVHFTKKVLVIHP